MKGERSCLRQDKSAYHITTGWRGDYPQFQRGFGDIAVRIEYRVQRSEVQGSEFSQTGGNRSSRFD